LASQTRTAFVSIVWEHGLQLTGRTGDNPQHVGSGRLLLQRVSELFSRLVSRGGSLFEVFFAEAAVDALRYLTFVAFGDALPFVRPAALA
jgi:hypothetical protein